MHLDDDTAINAFNGFRDYGPEELAPTPVAAGERYTRRACAFDFAPAGGAHADPHAKARHARAHAEGDARAHAEGYACAARRGTHRQCASSTRAIRGYASSTRVAGRPGVDSRLAIRFLDAHRGSSKRSSRLFFLDARRGVTWELV